MPRHAMPLSTERKREREREMQVLGFIQPPLGRLERLRLRAHVLRALKLGRNVIESSEGGCMMEKLTDVPFASFLSQF